MLAVTVVAYAQPHHSQSFISEYARSLFVTNGIPITNLAMAGFGITGVAATNVAGTIYTNAAGTKVTTATGTSDYVNLLSKATLWTDKNGGYVPHTGTSILDAGTNSLANIYIRILAMSGSTGAMTFTFVGSPDGVNFDTVAANQFVIAVTPTASGYADSTTALPMQFFPGYKYLYLKSIVNASTAASSGVTVVNCSLNGFIP